jgi:PilZ domain
MNVKDTLVAIRALGLVAGRVGGEWRINHRNSHKGCVGFCTAYCTRDKDVAFAAARAMSQWKDEHPTKRAKLLEEWKQACAEVQSDQWLQPAPIYFGPERRANPRDQITTPAVVRDDGPYSIFICKVRDASPAGAGLTLPNNLSPLPPEFDLTFKDATRHCIVVWQQRGRLGLKFKSAY